MIFSIGLLSRARPCCKAQRLSRGPPLLPLLLARQQVCYTLQSLDVKPLKEPSSAPQYLTRTEKEQGFSQSLVGHLEEPLRLPNQSQQKKEHYKKLVLEALDHRFHLQKEGLLDINQFSAFRAFNQFDDGIPGLVIDVYGQYALIHNYSIDLEIYMKSISNLLLRNPNHPITGVYLANHYTLEEPKTKFGLKVKSKTEAEADKTNVEYIPKLSKESTCISGKAAPDHVTTINENGFVYSVVLSKGIATGFEAGMREVRTNFVSIANIALKHETYKHVKNVVRSETALCAFSATCSLAVPLAYYGILTTNLDSSVTKLETGKKNFKFNGLPITIYNKDKVHHHLFWHKDVFRGLSSLGFEKKLFNFVFLSPPRKSWVPLDGTRGPSLNVLAHHQKYEHLLKENKIGGKNKNENNNNNPQKDLPGTILKGKKQDRQQNNKPKFTIYNFELIDNFSDLIVLSAPLVLHGGFLVIIVNITADEKERILKEAVVGFERLLLLKQKEIEEARYVKTRKNLRLRKIKKKERLTILKGSPLKPSLEEIMDQFSYTLVDVLVPPPDFSRTSIIANTDTIKPSVSDTHCYTFIWKRVEITPKVKQTPSPNSQNKLTKLLTEALSKNNSKSRKTNKTKTNTNNTNRTNRTPKQSTPMEK